MVKARPTVVTIAAASTIFLLSWSMLLILAVASSLGSNAGADAFILPSHSCKKRPMTPSFNKNDPYKRKNNEHVSSSLTQWHPTSRRGRRRIMLLRSKSDETIDNDVPLSTASSNTTAPEEKTSHSKNSRRQFLTTAKQAAIVGVASSTITTMSSFVGGESTAAAAAAATSPFVVPTPPATKDVMWPLGKVAFSLLPLEGTSTRRATVEECIVKDRMWTHDQLQGIVHVDVPVRQTVIRLQSNELWVHNPVAPTPQLLEYMQRIIETYDCPVKHIVLGTVALEHKATFGAFCQYFPQATVWIQPGQWAFPLNLPIDALGVTQKGSRLRELPVIRNGEASSTSSSSSKSRTSSNESSPTSSLFKATEKYGLPPWKEEIDYEVLGPFAFESVGSFSETAFYHRATKTLLVTDTVISVDKTPPPIIQEDPRALLFHARNNIQEVVEDTVETRQRGWRRMVQFGLVFFPSQIDVVPAGQAFQEASQIEHSMSNLGDGAVPLNLFPWTWRGNNDERNFESISQGGSLFCPPILTKLILDREPTKTIEWVDTVCRRFPDMGRIIPCHLNNNVQAKASDFSKAFDMLRSTPTKLRSQRPLAEDLALLQKASDLLTNLHIVGPSQVCDGELARVEGRFASS